MTIADNPKLRANRYPWNRPSSAARQGLDLFLELAQLRIDQDPKALPFPADAGRLVLAWLRARLELPPPA